MGWAVVFALSPLIRALPAGGIALLVTGGLCYTLGLIFYRLKRIRYMHSVWHLFVLAGAVVHFLCVLLYVILPCAGAHDDRSQSTQNVWSFPCKLTSQPSFCDVFPCKSSLFA